MSQRIPGHAPPIYAYRRGTSDRRHKANDNPEFRLQVAVATFLQWAMPSDWLWSASPAGMRASVQQGVKAKAAGLRRGWPDLMFLSPRGGTRYIELKAADGALSKEQKEFRDHCAASGQDMWAVCRSVDEVEAVLRRWNVPLTATAEKATRYA